ncbi:MAG: hypothetical protein R3C45_07285 [Phycisphaerales bacterium]
MAVSGPSSTRSTKNYMDNAGIGGGPFCPTHEEQLKASNRKDLD